MIRRLALGTVQFGVSYGVANRSGQVTLNETAAILQESSARGMTMLDTAIVYGDSEERLGKIGIPNWLVVSKLPEIPPTCSNVTEWVFASVADSLKRLGKNSLYGLLLHCPEQLLKPEGETLYGAMEMLKEQGLVRKIGVSIYNPEELDHICSRFRMDLIQAPFNILDRRLLISGWLPKLHQAGVEVHVRSIFLQGLLLMEAGKRPAKFNRWQPLWDQWHLWLKEKELTPVQACIGFVLSHPEIDRVVFGVDNVRQLEEILAAAEKEVPASPVFLKIEDLDIINPSRWEVL